MRRWLIAIGALALGACVSIRRVTRTPVSDSRCRVARQVAADTVIDYQARPGALRRLLSQTAPEYPEELRTSEDSGRVVVSLTIDTLGRVVHNSPVIESSSRQEFGDAVCVWLNSAQFEPVQRNGRPITARLRNVVVKFQLTR